MAICPATMKPCLDDICYGSGCLKMPGEPMLTHCIGCGELIALDGSDDEACECDEWGGPDEWDGADDDDD